MAWLSGRRRFKVTPEDGKKSGDPQLRVSPSPCCGRAKHTNCVVVNSRTGLWTCFKCGARGNWAGFCRRAGDPLADPYLDPPPVDLSCFEKIRALLRRPVSAGHHPALLRYALEERRLSAATLDAWKVSSAGPEAMRWPLFALSEGRWIMANARIRQVLGHREGTARDRFEIKGGPTCLGIGNHLLGIEPPLWRAERPLWASQWLDPSRTQAKGDESQEAPFPAVRRVLVVEGQWDAMTAWQLGIPNVLSLPNGAAHVDVSALLRYIPDDAEVWVAPDMDEAGDRAAEAFFAQLGSQVRRLRLPAKDLNDWLRASPDLTAEQVLATAEVDASPARPAGKRWVDLLATEESLPAGVVCETPWPLLTRRLAGGFYAGQTTGLLAPSGQGKTTLANNVAVHCAKKGVVCGLIQLEGMRGNVVSKLRAQAKGWIKPEFDEELPKYLARILLSDLAGKGVTWQQTIDEAAEMMRAGARLVIVDNWDYITPGDAYGARAKATAYAKFQELCKAEDAHGLVVWQPNKVDRADRVNSGQQKGLSTALQDSDVYMTLNKLGNARRLEVEKARVPEHPGESSVVILRYVVETDCLEESESQADLAATEHGKPPDDKL